MTQTGKIQVLCLGRADCSGFNHNIILVYSVKNISSPGADFFCGVFVIQIDKVPVKLIPVFFQGRAAKAFCNGMEESSLLHQPFAVIDFPQPFCPGLVVETLVGLFGRVNFSLVGNLPFLVILWGWDRHITDDGGRMSSAVSFLIGINPGIRMSASA